MRERLWNCISDDAKHLVQRMLEVDEKQRITVEEALRHPWIRVTLMLLQMPDVVASDYCSGS